MNKFTIRSLLATGLIAIALAVTPQVGAATPPPPENPAGPKQALAGNQERYAPGLTPLMEGEPGLAPQSVSQPRANALSGGLAWAPLTYKSYRDGNWEIYTAEGDGSNPVRLTSHPAIDVQPRMRRGGGRIVFASDRTGNAEIFSMAQDGSDVRQLTGHLAVDRNPSWSPDGAKIAFESNRDGQFEVYVMNADSSNLVRLTNSSGFDGQPTWSPNGARIAFTAYRNQQWRIWAMNADGSGLVQLNNNAYSENPIYSPDGKWLAYDHDYDFDGSMELCIMPAAGAAYCSYNYYNQDYSHEDALPRSFSSDSSTIAFTFAPWTILPNGGYAYTSFNLRYINVYTGLDIPFESSGLDLNPDWQTLDLLPPKSQVDPLPTFSRTGYILVGWSGEDSGTAGIKDYDIQGKVGTNGTEQNFWTAVASPNANYPGSAGDLVYFRARARDRAGNLEAWRAGWDTFTYFYKWLLEGSVTDAAGIAVEGAQVNQSIAAYDTQSTKADGRYARHLAGEGALSVGVTPPAGYGQLPAALRTVNADTTLGFALPPADNLIQNSWFDDEGLANWQADGALPAQADTGQAHSGSGSAELATELPVSIVSIETTSRSLSNAALHRSADGALHMLWVDSYPDNTQLLYKRRSPEGQWGLPEALGPGYFHFSKMGPDGTLHLFYFWNEVYYRFLTPGGDWSQASIVTSRINGIRLFDFSVDHLGSLHAVWEQNGSLFFISRAADGTWSNQEQIRSNGLAPAIAILPDDSLYVSWQEWTGSKYELFGMRRSLSAVWGNVESIPADCSYPIDLQMISNPIGELVALFTCSPGFRVTTRSAAGVWSPLESFGIDTQYNGYNGYSRAQFGQDGSLHVIWGNAMTYYQVRYPDGTWSGVWSHIWDGIQKSQALVADGEKAVLMVLGDSNTIPHVYSQYYLELSIPRNASSGLTQGVHIPADMHKPWLSFAYKMDDCDCIQAEFSVEANGNEIFSAAGQANDWSYGRADLSAYAGQDVTLTFRATSEGGAVPMRVNIDEVSIGSWRTPVVTGVTPQNWEAGLISVHGENFIATPQVYLDEIMLSNVIWIDANTLTAEAPAGLQPGRHRVRVVNPDGPGSSQMVYLVVGKEVFLPSINR